MTVNKTHGLPKWPFLVADVLLVGTAILLFQQANRPLTVQESAIVAACVAIGAFLGVLPFILDQRAAVRLESSASLDQALAKLGQLDIVAEQISSATHRWADVDTSASQTAQAAREIAERISSEAKAFTEFFQKANDTEKGNLRLELEKLRRSEGDWVQSAVRIMDHVYALYVAAMRSGQRNVIEQVGNFQNACIDTIRRQGLAPFIAKPNEPFDAARHKSVEEEEPPAGCFVEATLATGFTFQGRQLRPALVKVRSQAPEAQPAPTSTPGGDQLSLPEGS